MHRLAALSLGNRALIALVTVFVAVFGVVTMGQLKQELIPALEFPRISVVASQPGASPEVIDKQVAQPLEGALQAVEGLESSSSTSQTGFTTISLSFAYGTDLDRARAQVDKAISNARSTLPEDVEPSAFAGSISDFPIVYLAVSGGQDLNELRADVERLVLPRLSKVEGVRTAEVSGGTSQHIAVLPDAARLAAERLNANDLKKAVEEGSGLMPVGRLDTGGLDLPVTSGSSIDSLDAVKSLPVRGATGVHELAELAEVKVAADTATSITRTNGIQTLAVSVTKKPAGDTVGISHAVAALLPELAAQLGPDAKFTTVFDQAPFIEQSIHDLTVEGLLGLGFAVAVILVFLLSVRSTLVTAISIPLSLLVTFIGLRTGGYSLNMLTLGALTISIGRVVDDSIVVIENIKRHLSYGEEKSRAILTAVREVATAVTAATLTTVAVFLPVALVGGMAGELFRPFALTVTIALLASLLVSLTIVPVLAYWFLGHTRPGAADLAAARAAAERKEASSWLQRGYSPVLRKTQKHPVITLVAAVALLGLTVIMVPLVPTNLLGGTGQNTFSVTQKLPAGSSLDTTLQAAEPVEQALRAVDGVVDVQLTAGSPSGGFAAFAGGGTDSASFTVMTDAEADQEAIQAAARAAVDPVAGDSEISISAAEGGRGGSSDVTVRIGAPTPGLLAEATDATVGAMAGIEGATQVGDNLSESRPQVSIDVDRTKAAAAGLSEAQIGALAAGTLSPLPAGTVRLGYTDYPVQIGEGTELTDLDQLRNLVLPASGGTVKLGDVATIQRSESPATLTSSNGERIATVSITPGENDLGAVSAEVSRRLDTLALPAGATAELGGAATEQAESFSQLYLALLAAIAIVYVVMVATFKSLIQPLILLVSIPFAATGAIGLLLLTGVPLGLPSLIGMLMLVGIVVTNAIVLIDLINQYRTPRGGRPAMDLADAIHHGARQRLRPILMTALATIFALVPMALGLTGGGGFISRPLAVVVIGGLVSSTALTLVLVPVLYHLVEGAKERAAARRAERDSRPLSHTGTPTVAKAKEPTRELIAAMAAAGRTPPAGTAGNGAVPPPVSAAGAVSPGTLINPATGMIPLTRKERKEVESELKNKPQGS
ncbi:efflux RND transporter permease subunit [Paeniglutamicibacter sp. ABSL32-1]|uniref:efflux RND transporter permease subunit n=1 Tax=Paeniglutamicibacter quisquiliarum TaxID=2849498 RepID=UPI001C2CC698|nr:efflux RND transporter permease subunit [Paeniglutamicibacter quisquiliarum]MBV1779757.1 efflux RND transporter permease subunit [Paeniglutamicibacter quisquiliarum]